MLAAATANTIVSSPPLPIGWSGLLLFPCAYFTLRGSFTGSTSQGHGQGGIYGSGSRRACVDRSVVHFQRRPVEIGGRMPLETRKPITPIIMSSRRQSSSVICASALNARCGGGTALQTKPVTREAPTITKMRNFQQHKLDGSGKPPPDKGNNGGGGGNNGRGSTMEDPEACYCSAFFFL